MKRMSMLTCPVSRTLAFSAALLWGGSLFFAVPTLFAKDMLGVSETINNAAIGEAYTNSSETLATLRFAGATTHITWNQAITGNIRLEVNFPGISSNESRLSLTSDGNTFTGNLVLNQGTLRTDKASGSLGTGTIYLNGGSLMSSSGSLVISNNIVLGQDDIGEATVHGWGGIRPSNNVEVTGVISGNADFIVTSDSNTVTLSTPATYTGVTGISTVYGNASTPKLKMGADNVLPATTVVEIGKSQNTAKYTRTDNNAELQLNGTAQTIAGLYGTGKLLGAAAASTLNINMADGASQTFSGTLDGAAGGMHITLGKTASATTGGTQIFDGDKATTNTAFTVNAGTLTLAQTNTAALVFPSLTVNGGTLNINNPNAASNAVTGLTTVATGATLNINNGKGFTSGGLDGGGTITGLPAALTLQSTANANFSGSLAGVTSLTVDGGTSTQTISGSQDFSNTDITVSGGNLVIDATLAGGNVGGDVSLSGGSLSFGSNITGAVNTGTFTFTGGSLSLSAGQTLAVTGGLEGDGTVTGGTIDATLEAGQTYNFTGTLTGNSATDRLNVNLSGTGTQVIGGSTNASNADVTLDSGTLRLNKTNDTTAMSNLTLNGGTLELGNKSVMQRVSGRLTVGSGMGASIDLDGGILAATTYTVPSGFQFVNSSTDTATLFLLNLGSQTFTVPAYMDTSAGNNMRLGLEGSGGTQQIKLDGGQAFEGGIWVKNVVVRPLAEKNVQNGSFLGVLPATFQADSIILDGGTIQNTDSSVEIEPNRGITVTENGGTVRIGHSADYYVKIDSVISGPGWFGVSRDAAGEVQLYAENTYEGGTRIGVDLHQNGSNATLATYVDDALPTGGDVTLQVAGATLRLKGTTQNIGNLSNAGTIDFGGNTANLTAGNISGAGTTNITGGSLSANTISAGTFNLADGLVTADSITGGTYNMAGGDITTKSLTGGTFGNTVEDNLSVLTVDYGTTTANIAYAGGLSGNLQLLKTGAGRLELTGAGTLNHTGGTIIEGGILNTTKKIGLNNEQIEFNNRATLMVGATAEHKNDILLTGDGNLRTGGAAQLTMSGKITGGGGLYLNYTEAGASTSRILLTGENEYTGGTFLDGTNHYYVRASKDTAFGTGAITAANTNANGVILEFDTSSTDRTISNNVILGGTNQTNGNSVSGKLAFLNVGTGTAQFAGNLTGAGSLTSTGVDFIIDLDKYFVSADSVNAIWSGLTADLTFTDDVTFFLTSNDWETLAGAEFSIFDTVNSITGGNIAETSFSMLDLPAGMSVDVTGGSGLAFGIAISGAGNVPEPATWVLMLLAAAGIVVLRRKRGV